MSVTELLNTLGGIEETVLLYQGERGRPRARRILTRSTPPSSASTTSSASTPMSLNAELGTTPQEPNTPVDLRERCLLAGQPGRSR